MSLSAGSSRELDWFDEDVRVEDRGFEKIQQAIWKEGYKEGLSVSKEKNLQTGFEAGFVRSVTVFLPLGELKGRLQATIRFTTPPISLERLAIAQDLLLKMDVFFKDSEKLPPHTGSDSHNELDHFLEEQKKLQINLLSEIHEFMDRGARILGDTGLLEKPMDFFSILP